MTNDDEMTTDEPRDEPRVDAAVSDAAVRDEPRDEPRDDIRDTASIVLAREQARLTGATLRTLGIVVATIVTIVGLGLLAQRQLPPDEGNAVTVEPVRSAVLLCPEPGSSDADLGVRITAAVIPGQPGQDGGGSAALLSLIHI